MEYQLDTVEKETFPFVSGVARSIKRFVLLLIMSLAALISGCEANGTENDKIDDGDLIGSEDQKFQIAILPDTQYYTSFKHGGTMEMFEQQIAWIKENYEKQNIAYVVHLGDLVDHGEREMIEWRRAKDVMYQLETPVPGFPDGIPYGIAVGNHDQEPLDNPDMGTENGYTQYFGKNHFEGREYYGGAFGNSNNNDNHYDLFSANGENYIVLYLEYNEPGTDYYSPDIEAEVFEWAQGILEDHSDHKAIIVSHSILARPAGSTSITTGGEGDNSLESEYTKAGKRIYDAFKNSPNVFMMLCGHRSGEGMRVDTYNGNTIMTFLSDYQSRENSKGIRNGGGGLMRTMEINKTKKSITVKTFAPHSGGVTLEGDADSFFTVDLID